METGERKHKIESPNRRVRVACPECRQGYKIAARLLGRRLVCRHCRHEWRAYEDDASDVRAAPPLTSHDSTSDSTKAMLPEDFPPVAGSSSTIIDTSWIGKPLGRYRILSVLGQGGMGVVWRGHDDTLRRDVALKILNRARQTTTGGLNTELFMQEARAVAKLQHPAVVSIFEVGQDQGQVFLSLELMEGGTLKEYIERNGPIAARELFRLMAGPAKALALAHKRGIIHRDIKPGNLMFDDHGHLKLMDFGLAEVTQEAASAKMKGKAVGSLGWVAPETVRGKGTTAQSDIYGLGLVMLYALKGKPVFQANSRQQLIALHQNPPPIDFKDVRGLTLKAERMLRKCLAVEQADRYETADELASALMECSDEDPLDISRRRKSHTAVAAAAAAIGLLVGVSGVMYYFLQLNEQLSSMSQPVARVRPPIVEPEDENQLQPEELPAPKTRTSTPADPRLAALAKAHVPWPQVPELIQADRLTIVASKTDNLYHSPTAECGRSILASDLLMFVTSKDAEAEGLKPCPKCDPKSIAKPDFVMGPDEDNAESSDDVPKKKKPPQP